MPESSRSAQNGSGEERPSPPSKPPSGRPRSLAPGAPGLPQDPERYRLRMEAIQKMKEGTFEGVQEGAAPRRFHGKTLLGHSADRQALRMGAIQMMKEGRYSTNHTKEEIKEMTNILAEEKEEEAAHIKGRPMQPSNSGHLSRSSSLMAPSRSSSEGNKPDLPTQIAFGRSCSLDNPCTPSHPQMALGRSSSLNKPGMPSDPARLQLREETINKMREGTFATSDQYKQPSKPDRLRKL